MKLFLERELEEVLEGVNERASCGRLCVYLQQCALDAGLTKYVADTEYNRKQDGKVKTILDDEYNEVTINCDLILHSRGKLVAEDNLIAIEMKKVGRRATERKKDQNRLRALTKSSYDGVWSADEIAHPEHVCGYVLGVFVEFDRRKRTCLLEYYAKGEKIEECVVGF